jgi:AcrR family transcriptional regulator
MVAADSNKRTSSEKASPVGTERAGRSASNASNAQRSAGSTDDQPKKPRATAQAKASTTGRRRTPAELELRRLPMQARGRATFERILDTTAQLLEEVGTDAITTNLVAQEARVNVATLYQYFPNKQALLLALFQRYADQRVAVGQSLLTGLGAAENWRDQLSTAIDAIVEVRRNTTGTAALRQAMRSTPDLLGHDLQGARQAAQIIAAELVRRGRTSADEAAVVARCCVEMLGALLDFWSIEARRKDPRIIVQMKAALSAYLAPYLDAEPTPA